MRKDLICGQDSNPGAANQKHKLFNVGSLITGHVSMYLITTSFVLDINIHDLVVMNGVLLCTERLKHLISEIVGD